MQETTHERLGYFKAFSKRYFSITTGPSGITESAVSVEQQLANPRTMNPSARVVISFFIRVVFSHAPESWEPLQMVALLAAPEFQSQAPSLFP